VLVIEDDPELAEAEAVVLSAEGYRVLIAPDGRAALNQLQHERPNLILLDMRMPGMNGWEFAESLHATHGNDIPVVVVTAAYDPDRRAKDVGAVDFLTKPFELDEFVEKVARYARPAHPQTSPH
jgi:CheY-like chemotaxis protein